jgi:hypothetical protein
MPKVYLINTNKNNNLNCENDMLQYENCSAFYTPWKYYIDNIDVTLASLITLCSGEMNRPLQDQMVVLGTMSIRGTVMKVPDLADALQEAYKNAG